MLFQKLILLKVFRDLSSNIIEGTVATIGIFDGVHKAHREIIDRLCTLAQEKDTESLLITLWPHPRYVLDKNASELKLLSTLDEKLLLLEEAGIDNILLIPFDKQFASLSFDKFIQRVLLDKLKISYLVVGYNHQFGRNREGNFEKLKDTAGEMGVGIEQLPKIEIENERISSSVIRNYISQGNIEFANKMLGYRFALSGTVVHGEKVGRQLGFPTANLELHELYKIIPAQGVYAIKSKIDDQEFLGMLNIGVRPTIDDKGLQIIEANIFDFYGDLYNKNIRIEFFKRIREERKFGSVEDLKEQINIDKKEIQNFFNLTKGNIL